MKWTKKPHPTTSNQNPPGLWFEGLGDPDVGLIVLEGDDPHVQVVPLEAPPHTCLCLPSEDQQGVPSRGMGNAPLRPMRQ